MMQNREGREGTMATEMTHEGFINAVRVLAIARIHDAEQRAALLSAKVVYGVGAVKGTRGVTIYGAWKPADASAQAFVEITAQGEESDVQLAGTTIHELGHVLAGHGHGHAKGWKDACAALGLNARHAGGQDYKPEDFDADLWAAIEQLPTPTDGRPMLRAALGGPVQVPATPRPCPMGIGTRGGKSRGTGSGSRLRLWLCQCARPVKVRVASDDFQATCKACGSDFERPALGVAGKEVAA
jgi:hypothetical protein